MPVPISIASALHADPLVIRQSSARSTAPMPYISQAPWRGHRRHLGARVRPKSGATSSLFLIWRWAEAEANGSATFNGERSAGQD